MMATLTKKELRKAIEQYLPTGVEMHHATAIKTWLLENIFDYEVWIRSDFCCIVVEAMEKEGFFSSFRSPVGTKVFVRN